MIVKVDLPERDVWKLVGIAQRRGHITAGQLLTAATAEHLAAELVTQIADSLLAAEAVTIQHRSRPSTRARQIPTYDIPLMRERIRVMHGRNLNDRQMAMELGCATETVRKRRNELGLPPNGHTRKANA